MVDRVRLLLDVDGVLNPVGSRCPDWQEWNVASCRGLPITHSLELGRAIADLDVDVVWLSTWREDANRWIGPLFGWPGHSVIVVDDEDMLSWRSWWKLDAAKSLYAGKPQPVIWADWLRCHRAARKSADHFGRNACISKVAAEHSRTVGEAVPAV